MEVRMRTNSPEVVRSLVPWAQKYKREGEDLAGAQDRFVSESQFRKRRTPTPQQQDALEAVYGKRYLIIRRSRTRTLYIDRSVHGQPAYYRDERGRFLRLRKKEHASVERARKRQPRESNYVDYPVKPKRQSTSKKEQR